MLAAHYHVQRPFRIAGARLTVAVTSRRRLSTSEIVDALAVGDQLVHRADNGNSVSVYRAGKLLGTTAITTLALGVMTRGGWIQRTDAATREASL